MMMSEADHHQPVDDQRKEPPPAITASKTSAGPSTTSSASNRWRLRDAAHELHQAANLPFYLHKQQQQPEHDDLFDVDTALARLRRDKLSVIQTAFGTAATVLLLKDHPQKSTTTTRAPLPPLLEDLAEIARLKHSVLETAHGHKQVVVVSAAPASPNKQSSSSITVKIKKESIASTQKQPLIKPVSKGSEPDVEGSMKKPPDSVESKDSSVKDLQKQKGASTNDKTKDNPVTPSIRKYTRNTPASTAAALDGRLTKSRAILCTAAKFALERLTPPPPPTSSDEDVLMTDAVSYTHLTLPTKA